jgi:hypothetical protein
MVDLTSAFAPLIAGAVVLVGLFMVLRTRLRRAGAVIVLGAVGAYGVYFWAYRGGLQDLARREFLGSFTLTVSSSAAAPFTVEATCITWPEQDRLDKVVTDRIGKDWAGLVVRYVDDAPLSLLVDDHVRYEGELPGFDPERDLYAGSSRFSATVHGPVASGAPRVVSGTVSWTCDVR